MLALEERRGGKSARTRIGVQQRRSVAIGPGVGEGARDGMAERGLSCCSKHRQPVLGFLSVVVGRLALPLCPSTTQYSRTRLPHCFFSFLLCSRPAFNSIKHRPLRPLPHLFSADNRNGTSVILPMTLSVRPHVHPLSNAAAALWCGVTSARSDRCPGFTCRGLRLLTPVVGPRCGAPT